MSRTSARPRAENIDYRLKPGDDVTIDPMHVKDMNAGSSNANSIFATIKMKVPSYLVDTKKAGVSTSNKKKETAAGKENMMIVDQESKYDDENNMPIKVKAAPAPTATSSFFSIAAKPSTNSFFSLKSNTVPVPIPSTTTNESKKRSSPPSTKQGDEKRAKKDITAKSVAAPIPTFEFEGTQASKKQKKLTGIAASNKKSSKAEELEDDDITMQEEERKEETRVGSAMKKSAAKEKKKPAVQKAAEPIAEPMDTTESLPPMEPIPVAAAAPVLPAKPAVTNMAKRTPPKPVASASTTHSVSIAVGSTPNFLRSNLLSPQAAPKPSVVNMQATTNASALLHDFSSTVQLQKLLAEKDALFESLLAKHNSLKQAKKIEAQEFVTKHAEDGLASAAAMVAHYKTELQEKNALITKLQSQVDTIPGIQSQQTQEKQRLEAVNRALQTQVDMLSQKLQSTESSLATAHTELSSLHSLQYPRVLKAYNLLTSMTIQSKDQEEGWVNCRMTNEQDARVLDFDLEIDAEEEVEYAPKKIDLNGINYPSWMAEGLIMQPEMAPRLLKIMLQNVYKKEESDQ